MLDKQDGTRFILCLTVNRRDQGGGESEINVGFEYRKEFRA